MKEKYDIVEYDHGKPLTGAIFRDVDLTLDKFKLGDVDKFLDYAKSTKVDLFHFVSDVC